MSFVEFVKDLALSMKYQKFLSSSNFLLSASQRIVLKGVRFIRLDLAFLLQYMQLLAISETRWLPTQLYNR